MLMTVAMQDNVENIAGLEKILMSMAILVAKGHTMRTRMNNLTDDEEQEAKCLIVKQKFPCGFLWILQRLGWVINISCPMRTFSEKQIRRYFQDKENDEYEKNYPDG